MMTKEDYLRLPKERLAELLAERDAQLFIGPYIPPLFSRPLTCIEGGPCTNPQMDCVNCPRRGSTFPSHTLSVKTNTKED